MTPENSPSTGSGTGSGPGISLDSGAVRGMNLAARRRRSQEREAAARAGADRRTSGLESDFALGLAGAREGSRRDGDGHGEGENGENGEGSDADSAAEGDTTVVTPRLLEKLGYVRRPCSVCHHSFRLGEEVTVHPAQGGAGWVLRHSSRLLGCESNGSRPAASSRLPADFHRGLAETNPPPPELHVTRLATGDPLLAVGESPGGASGGAPPMRHTCWVCGMTLRQGEVVIRCTCSPENPQCLCAVHRDPDRGLVCYDRWKANYEKIPCLMRNEPRA